MFPSVPENKNLFTLFETQYITSLSELCASFVPVPVLFCSLPSLLSSSLLFSTLCVGLIARLSQTHMLLYFICVILSWEMLFGRLLFDLV